MNSLKRQRLLVQIAKLYYEEEYSQEEIAKALDLSRPYVSKLLNVAKEEGIVRIQVVDPLNIETALEQKIRERFSLKKAIVVPTDTSGDPLTHVAEAGARYLDTILKDGDIIGASWGRTLFACSEALHQRTDLTDIRSVILCGAVSDASQTTFSTDIINNFSRKLGASCFMLPVPAVVDTKEVKELLQKDGSLAQAIQLWEETQVALLTVGSFGQQNALYRAGFLSEADMTKLEGMGAVGDICSHVIDIDGKICDEELDARSMGISLEALKEKEQRICVAQGFSKVNSICGALRGGIINVLITDEETAERVLVRLDAVETAEAFSGE